MINRYIYITLISLFYSTGLYSQVCYLGFNSGSIDDVCEIASPNLFENKNDKAEPIIDKILSQIGGSKRFIITKECPGINNAIAYLKNDYRYILYDPSFIETIDGNPESWRNILILSHEIGHHQKFHTMPSVFGSLSDLHSESNEQLRSLEIEADEFAGFILQKLGASLEETAEAMSNLLDDRSRVSSTHPAKKLRIDAIKQGWENAKANVSDRELSMGIQDYYDLGRQKMIDEEYEEALEAYSVAVQLDPEYYQSYTNRGKAWLELGNHKKGIEDNSTSLNIKPTWIAYKNRGFAWYKLGEYQKSISDYSESIKLNPNSNTYYQRGLSKFRLELDKEAIDDYFQAITLTDKTDVNFKKDLNLYYYSIAFAYYYIEGVGSEKILLYTTKAIENDINDAESYGMRANHQLIKGDALGSIKDATKVIEIGGVSKDKQSEAYFIRGQSHYEISNYKQSILDLSNSINLDLNNPNAHFYRAESQISRYEDSKNLNDIYGAISDYTRVIQLDNNFKDIYYKRAIAKDILEDNDGAILDFNKALELDPKNEIYLNNRGLFYHNLKEYDKAIQDFNSSIEVNPNRAKTYYFRANSSTAKIYSEIDYYDYNDDGVGMKINHIGKFKNAIADYNYVTKFTLEKKNIIDSIDKDYDQSNFTYSGLNIDAFNNIADIYISNNMFDSAKLYLDKADEISKNHFFTLLTYANYYRMKKDELKKEIKNFELILKLLLESKVNLFIDKTEYMSNEQKNGHLVWAYNNLGLIYLDKGDYNNSIEYFNNAIKIDDQMSSLYNNRYIANYELGNYDLCLADLNKSLEIAPYNAAGLYNRGNLRSDLGGDPYGAISDYTAAIEVIEDPRYYNNRGTIKQVDFNDLNAAFLDYRNAHELDKTNSLYLINMIEVKFELGDIIEAEEYCNLLLETKISETLDYYYPYYYLALINIDNNTDKSCKYLNIANQLILENKDDLEGYYINYKDTEVESTTHIFDLVKSYGCE